MPFPLVSPPADYCTFAFPATARNGIFYVGGSAPTMTLSQATPNAYEVLDYWGTVVSSGAVSGTSLTPAAPVGGWDPGWYRLYLTGANTDATYGPSYGATNFVVLRNDSRFPANPNNSPDPGAGKGGGEAKDWIFKGLLGIGSSRHQIVNADAPTTGFDNIAMAEAATPLAQDYWADPINGAYVDTVRPERRLMISFPNRTFDRLEFTSGNPGFRIFVKDPSIDGSQVFLQVENGTSSGKKYTVRFPDSSTIVETYDNIADAPAAIAAMASSAYVKPFGGAGANPANQGPTAIGKSFRDGVIQVVQTMSAAPHNIMVYEGPVNESDLNTQLVHAMRLFQDAVHTGNAAAKAIGPCVVEVNAHYLAGWETFLAAGGGDYCDEISFHAYNSQTNGDINLGRAEIEGFLAKLAEHGQDTKPLWCTESTHVFTSIYGWDPAHNNGTYHPRRSRVPLLQTLQWEQYGLPRERNHVWYDKSHGFWSYPSFLAHGNEVALVPYAALYRTLAEETFGQVHDAVIDFGSDPANAIFLGSIYAAPSGASTAVVVAQSYMPDASVTFNVTGTSSPLTVVDGFGNETTVSITAGKATVPVADIPTYVRLPTGVSVTVAYVNDWSAPRTSLSASAATKKVGATTTAVIADDAFLSSYGFRTGVFISSGALPETAELQWASSRTIDRVVIFCGPVWQDSSAFTDFDVETTVDGTNWTVRETVVNSTSTSFLFGTSSSSSGTKIETFWDEQWIFDVPLGSAITCTGVRLTVRGTSYGGEPDFDAIDAGGQGAFEQHIVLQEVMALEAVGGASSVFSRPGIVGGSGGSAFVRYGGA